MLAALEVVNILCHSLFYLWMEIDIERSCFQANYMEDLGLSDIGVDRCLYITEALGVESGRILFKGVRGMNGVESSGKFLDNKNGCRALDICEYWVK